MVGTENKSGTISRHCIKIFPLDFSFKTIHSISTIQYLESRYVCGENKTLCEDAEYAAYDNNDVPTCRWWRSLSSSRPW